MGNLRGIRLLNPQYTFWGLELRPKAHISIPEYSTVLSLFHGIRITGAFSKPAPIIQKVSYQFYGYLPTKRGLTVKWQLSA